MGRCSVISIHAPRVGCAPRRPCRRWPRWHFNPRTPCGVRRPLPAGELQRPGISIHAPRVGCDDQVFHGQPGVHAISIHAPRVGCDPPWTFPSLTWSNFNPRTPCGVRRSDGCVCSSLLKFQSTHPVWGATAVQAGAEAPRIFQSTHPVWGATCWTCGRS